MYLAAPVSTRLIRIQAACFFRRKAELERQNTSLGLELAAASAQLSQAESQCSELQSQVSDAQTQLASTQETCILLETQVSDAQAQQQTWSALESEFERLNSDQATQLQETQLRCAELQEEVRLLKHEVTDAHAVAAEHTGDLQQQLVLMQQQLSTAQSDCNSLQQQCSELKLQLESDTAADHAALAMEMQQQYSKLKLQLESNSAADHAAFASELHDSQVECNQLQAALDQVKADYSASLLSRSVLEFDINNLIQESSAVRAEIAASQEQHALEFSRSASQPHATASHTSQKPDAGGIVQQMQSHLTSQLEKATAELHLTKQHCTELQSQLETVTAEESTAQQSLSGLQLRFAESEAAVARLTSELSNLQTQLTATQLRCSELQKQLAEAEQRLGNAADIAEHPLSEVNDFGHVHVVFLSLGVSADHCTLSSLASSIPSACGQSCLFGMVTEP